MENDELGGCTGGVEPGRGAKAGVACKVPPGGSDCRDCVIASVPYTAAVSGHAGHKTTN